MFGIAIRNCQPRRWDKKIEEDILSISFWNSVETCMNVSLPLLRVLRIVDGDERLVSLVRGWIILAMNRLMYARRP
jgi:hypothetical protein